MGFSEVIVKDTLLDPLSKHYPTTETESNYFGFPETELKPYLQDLFRGAEKKNSAYSSPISQALRTIPGTFPNQKDLISITSDADDGAQNIHSIGTSTQSATSIAGSGRSWIC
jgi:hypothetical protein